MWLSWIVAVLVGAFAGWIVGLSTSSDERYGTIGNVLTGMVGAILARLIFGDLLGIGAAGEGSWFAYWSVVWGVVGAVLLTALLRALRVLR